LSVTARSDPSCLATLCARQRRLTAAIAQLGERQTEDLKVPGSIPGLGIFFRADIVARIVPGGLWCTLCALVGGYPSGTMRFSCFENLACQAEFCVCGCCCRVVLGGPRDMVAFSGLTLLVIVCQCGMLTLVLVCLGADSAC
jgi:hypothetical protein